MRTRATTSTFAGTPGAAPRVLLAVAAVVLAALLPGLHGLSLGGHACDDASCRDAANTPAPAHPAPGPVARARKAACTCGHDHAMGSHGPAPGEPIALAPDPCDDPAPAPSPEPHDHRNCPICKIIFTGPHRVAADTARPVVIEGARPIGRAPGARDEAPRATPILAARPRGPPARPGPARA